MSTMSKPLAIPENTTRTYPIYAEDVFVRTEEIFCKSPTIELVLYRGRLQCPIALQQLKELLTPWISQHKLSLPSEPHQKTTRRSF